MGNDSSDWSTTDLSEANTRPILSCAPSALSVMASSSVSCGTGNDPVVGCTSGYKKLKLVKRGHMALSDPLVCGVSFEALPSWLWSFRVSDWSSIVLTDTDERKLRQYHFSTWSFWKTKLAIVSAKEHFSCGRHDAVVWFVSGSRTFLRPFEGFETSCPVIYWAEGCGRRRPLDSRGRKWLTVSHATVGGSTTARGVFGVSGLHLVVPDDPLERTLGHVIKFSERPVPCSVPVAAAHYTVDDRLSLTRLDQPVLFQSGFSRSGWGLRSLIPPELSQAFDLPAYLLWTEASGPSLLPVQMFRVVGDAVLESLRGPRAGSETATRRPRVDIILEGTATTVRDPPTWLADIGRWLPGSWADAKIASKAVKSDDADVDYRPWNLRISLVFPAASATAIRGFEVLGLRLWRAKLARSFFVYLRQRYGPQWSLRLAAARAHRRAGGSASRKRSRSQYEVMEHHKEGGTIIDDDRLVRDVSCGSQVLNQVMRSGWWDWCGGSSLFFWRWNGDEQIRAARDGLRIFVAAPLPTRVRQKCVKLDGDTKVRVAAKLATMFHRGYLERGHVENTVHYFAVPKGDDDIRVVFDGTSSGLNETLFAPNFHLPSARSAAMVLTGSTWMSDMDFGEMFHNFHLDPTIRPFAGVRIEQLGMSIVRPEGVSAGGAEKVKGVSTLRWTRIFMGMRPSPYNAVRQYYWGEEFARGNPANETNPMGYDRIRINLPGMLHYDPSLPKVMKWRDGKDGGETGGGLAGDVVTFIDDVRITGRSKEHCHAVRRQFAARVQFLGMQDAPRKLRPPSQLNAGAWTGTIFKIGDCGISKSVSQEKWEKGRRIVGQWAKLVEDSPDGRPQLNRKQLEKETGFMNHLAMTYETMNPFLKGFYLSLNSWRTGRDHGDWKLSPKRWKALLFANRANGLISEEELEGELDRSVEADAPEMVTASIHLKGDLVALQALFGPMAVPEVGIRSRNVVTIVYGFGDASGTGLGATFTCGSGFNFRIGVWGSNEEPESSNWKEFTNIVESLEEEAELGHLANSEVYMFTDNSTVEACAAKGSSSSEKLLGLVVRLYALTSKVGVKINVFHVAGTRMIAQGTDGVSRGYLGQGVMAGDTMTVHIPIHLSAVERAPADLVPWIRSWSGDETILLDEAGWFQAGHDVVDWSMGADGFERPRLASGRRAYIWAPAPLAAEVAIAELRKARIKRQSSCHVFVCPRLCSTQWVKQLYRAADIVFEVPIGVSFWPALMHEPLLIGILFPFLSVKPWQIRGTPKMFAVGRELRRVFEDSEMDARDILCQLWALCHNLGSMQECMVRKLLSFK